MIHHIGNHFIEVSGNQLTGFAVSGKLVLNWYIIFKGFYQSSSVPYRNKMVVGVCSSDKMIPLLCFFVSSEFGACYIAGQWCEFRIKNITLYFHILSRYMLFYIIKFLFCVFWWNIKFPQHKINQLETGISGQKLTVGLYDRQNLAGIYLLKVINENPRAVCEISKLTIKTPYNVSSFAKKIQTSF